MLLQGLKNSSQQESPEKKKIAPVTFELLKTIRNRLDGLSWRAATKTAVWTFCCVAYFGSFRAGELLAKKDWRFDKSSDLLWSDVNLDPEQAGGDCATIRIRSPKTGSRNELVELFAFPMPKFCLVNNLKKLKKSQQNIGIWSADAPVFRLGSGKNLSVKKLSGTMSKIFRKTCYSHLRVSASSFRSGVPTDMEGRPDIFGDTQIRSWGRWKSEAFRRYMKCERTRKREIFDQLSRLLMKNANSL